MTMLTGSGAPTGGSDGDLWVDIATLRLYGPKAAGVWPATYETLGAANLLNGIVAPTTEGTDGDFYLDTVNDRLYGPKTAGLWTDYITLGAQATYISSKALTQRIMFRRDTAANWTSENPILTLAEPGFETDTLKLKIGDAATEWDELPYIGVLPSGGLTGQVPAKASDLDGDWIFATPVGTGTVTNTGLLTASALMVGNGVNDSKVLVSLGTTTTVLHGNAAGLPTFGAVSLTADVTGTLPLANGGTGGTSAATARTAIGLVIGTDVQAFHALLAAVAGLTGAADKGIQFTGASSAATYDLTTAGKALLDDADASAQRTTLLAAARTQAGEMFQGYIPTVADKTYKVVLKAAHPGTVAEATTISESGTCTATFKINTTALGGTANSVSTSEQSQAHVSANAFVAGDDVQITTSGNSSCLGLSWAIKYSRTLS